MLSMRRDRTRRAAGRENRGELKGLKGNNVSSTQAIRQVSTATGKRRRLPMCLCLLHHHPTPLSPPPSTADKHMWADNMTLPVKRGRDRQREKQRERGRTRSLSSPDIPGSDS